MFAPPGTGGEVTPHRRELKLQVFVSPVTVLSPLPLGEGEGEGPLVFFWNKKPLTPTLSRGEREEETLVLQEVIS